MIESASSFANEEISHPSQSSSSGDDCHVSFSRLPREIVVYTLCAYCDASCLGHLLRAYWCDSRRKRYFWSVLTSVVDHRITEVPTHDEASRNLKEELRIIAKNILEHLDSECAIERFRAFDVQLCLMTYVERLQNILWCGRIEFRDSSMPYQSARTANIVVMSDTDGWSWTHAYNWNRAFPGAIKVSSQLYNFVPVKPRGHMIGVTTQDREILQSVSSQLQAFDHVMALRFENSPGFILRIVSPEQARQRLARFGTRMVAAFSTFPNSLVCSWECHSQNLLSMSDLDKIQTIERLVEMYDGLNEEQ